MLVIALIMLLNNLFNGIMLNDMHIMLIYVIMLFLNLFVARIGQLKMDFQGMQKISNQELDQSKLLEMKQMYYDLTKLQIFLHTFSITLWKLQIYNLIIINKRVVHQIYNYNYSIQDQQNYIFTLIDNHKKCDFKSVFNICQDRIHAIVTFLAFSVKLPIYGLHF